MLSTVTCTTGVCAFGRQAVSAVGPVDATIALVGEAPGAQELKYGVPFVGRAGERLDNLCANAGLVRSQLYITNTCGCVDMSRDVRKPTLAELDACRPRLLKELEFVSPKVCVLMGNTALSYWFPGYRIGQIYNSVRVRDGIAFVATYHPAAALRSPHLDPVITEGLALARRIAREAA